MTDKNEMALAEQPESSAIMQVIERAAMNPDVDIDKMERLLQMQERILDRNSEMAFNSAMAAAQAEMGPVVRNASNSQTNSQYSTIEAIARSVKPILTKNGFATSFGSDQSPLDGHYRVTCCVSHSEGYSRDYHADVPTDATGIKGSVNKTNVHAFGSTMTYGRRYLMMLIFDITTDDDDGNASGAGQTINEDQYKTLQKLIKDTGTNEDAFLKYYKAANLEQLPMHKYGAANARLTAKLEAK